MASPRASIPRSPCRASAGCRKNEGVPVLERVAEILRQISPDLPMPVTAIRPLQANRTSTAFTKVLSRRDFTSCRARASISSTRRAVSRLTANSLLSSRLLNWGAAVPACAGRLRPYGVLGCAEAHPYNGLLGAMNLILQDFFSQRRTTDDSSFRRASKPANCASGNAFAPSERAALGLSWVSRKLPSTPAATTSWAIVLIY